MISSMAANSRLRADTEAILSISILILLSRLLNIVQYEDAGT